MSGSGNTVQRHFFSMHSVDFSDDADIEAFAQKVWQEVARREGERAQLAGQDSPVAPQGEEQA